MQENHELGRQIVDLTRDLVLIPSTEGRPDERARCFQLVRQHLDGIEGIEVRRFESGGFESIVVAPSGVVEPGVLLVAHLDVIEHGDAAFYRSEVRDGRIVGPGTGDMKGQLAILVELFRRLQKLHPGLPVGLAVTSDEERGGEHGIGYLFGPEVGLRCGVAVVPDGGSPTDVTVEEKGILHLRLSVEGREIHAARPWLGDNAVLRLSRALTATASRFEQLRGDLPEGGDHWYTTFSPTIVGTSNKTINCLPGDASALVDIRFTPPHRSDDIEGMVRDSVGEGIDVEILVAAEPTHLAPDPLFLDVAQKHAGESITLVRASGGSDARFIAHGGMPVILSRPRVGNLHGLDEWIDIGSMIRFYQVCEDYVLRKLLS